MPISPFICIEFQDISINSSDNLIVQLSQDKARFLNEANINTANYYVISDKLIELNLIIIIYITVSLTKLGILKNLILKQ